MEQHPHLYRIDAPGTPEDGTPRWWPCPSLDYALEQFNHTARWLSRAQRRQCRLYFEDSGNQPGNGGTFRTFAINPGGITEITDKIS